MSVIFFYFYFLPNRNIYIFYIYIRVSNAIILLSVCSPVSVCISPSRHRDLFPRTIYIISYHIYIYILHSVLRCFPPTSLARSLSLKFQLHSPAFLYSFLSPESVTFPTSASSTRLLSLYASRTDSNYRCLRRITIRTGECQSRFPLVLAVPPREGRGLLSYSARQIQP